MTNKAHRSTCTQISKLDYKPIMTDIVPPVLSSDQDDQYLFQKFETNLNQRLYLGPDVNSLNDKIREYYSIDKLVEFLKTTDTDGTPRYKSITLQFPDDLITDSAIIVQMLQTGLKNANPDEIDFTDNNDHHHRDHHHDHTGKGGELCTEDIEAFHKPCTDKKNGACTCDKKSVSKQTGQKIWILADTSYSPCCIDEVAAEHVSADLVVHFGDACLNAVEKLPLVYVFGKPYLDHALVISKFHNTYPEKDTKICLMADAPFSHHLLELYQLLKAEYKHLIYADISNSNNSLIIDHYNENTENAYNFSNRLIYGLDGIDKLQDDDDDDTATQEYELFHINIPQAPRLLELSTKFSTITTFDINSNEVSQGPYPSLMKRYRFMHVARTAGTIGILVNTLSLSNTKELLNKVSGWIKNAGKKHYMFVVGKPNVAKLANFESIDIWCILGCGQSGIIIDNVGDYYKPIITPYELQMALSDEVSWTGKWIVDFKQVMSLGQLQEEQIADLKKASDELENDYEEDAPEFDSVTGKYISSSRPLRRYVPHLEIEDSSTEVENNGNEDDRSLVKKFSSLVMIKGTVSTSAVALQKRQWTGLGSDFQNDEDIDEEGALVEEGIGGVARGYNFDRENINI